MHRKRKSATPRSIVFQIKGRVTLVEIVELKGEWRPRVGVFIDFDGKPVAKRNTAKLLEKAEQETEKLFEIPYTHDGHCCCVRLNRLQLIKGLKTFLSEPR